MSTALIRYLAIIGAIFLTFTSIALLKFFIALQYQTDFKSVLTPAPPSRSAFANKVFWITGASSGIGKAFALHLCSSYDDVKLILSSRRKNILEEVATECRNLNDSNDGTGVDVKVLVVDLANHKSLPSKAKEALSLYDEGNIDILMNVGGVSTRSMARNANFDVDTFVTNVDFLSYVALTKALLPSWENDPKKRKHMVINTSSVAGKIGGPVRTAYSGAKHALMGWFDGFRVEQVLLGYPIHVLNVVLGSTQTNIARNAITTSPDQTFGDDTEDRNIQSGLETDFVVERILAAAYAGRDELWIAPKTEMLLLYLNQYIPETARMVMTKVLGKQYAVQKEERLGGEEKDNEL